MLQFTRLVKPLSALDEQLVSLFVRAMIFINNVLKAREFAYKPSKYSFTLCGYNAQLSV